MRIFTRIISIILTVSLLSACSFGGGDSSDGLSALETIKQNDKIRIGVFGDKPPFGYLDESGKHQGYDIYLAKRMAKDLLGDENKIEYILLEAANRVEYLESDRVDVVLANFTVTDARKEKVDFASPYMQVGLGIVSNDADPITDVQQLFGKKLIVNKGTTADAYFTENFPEIELLKYDHNTEAFQALIDGRGAALAHDNTLLFAWAKQNDGYTTHIPSIGNVDVIAPAVNKGNAELLDWVNNEIAMLIDEGFFEIAYDETLLPIYGDEVNREDVLIPAAQ